MADIEQQARELLAAEYWCAGSIDAANDLRANRMDERLGWVREANIALRAVARALRAAPDGFALVDLDEYSVLPDAPTEQMLDVGWPDHEFIGATFDKEGAYADLLAAVRVPTTLSTVKPPRNRRTRLREDV